MPPKGMPQPPEEQRQAAATWVRAELGAYAKKHDGEPGRVTVRRLTSGEYAYSIQDLTGVEVEDTGIDASSDSVGGEGFTNFGDVQFMQDQNLERYLEAAKRVADHAVIGSGRSNSSTIPARRASSSRRFRGFARFMPSTGSARSRAKAAGRSDWSGTARRFTRTGDSSIARPSASPMRR